MCDRTNRANTLLWPEVEGLAGRVATETTPAGLPDLPADVFTRP